MYSFTNHLSLHSVRVSIYEPIGVNLGLNLGVNLGVNLTGTSNLVFWQYVFSFVFSFIMRVCKELIVTFFSIFYIML